MKHHRQSAWYLYQKSIEYLRLEFLYFHRLVWKILLSVELFEIIGIRQIIRAVGSIENFLVMLGFERMIAKILG
jgi:hypothetical protein